MDNVPWTSVTSVTPTPAASVAVAAAVSGLLLISEVAGREMRCGAASDGGSSGRSSTRARRPPAIGGLLVSCGPLSRGVGLSFVGGLYADVGVGVEGGAWRQCR